MSGLWLGLAVLVCQPQTVRSYSCLDPCAGTRGAWQQECREDEGLLKCDWREFQVCGRPQEPMEEED